MQLILFLIAILVYFIYLLVEFIVPIITMYLILTSHEPIWLWSTLLIVWFVARMTLYIINKRK